MIKHLQELLEKALEDLKRNGEFPKDLSPEIIFERTKSKEHGDFATNLALTLAKPLKKSPRDIAQLLTDNLIESLHVSKVEVAGPGFINFFLTENCRRQVIKQIIKQGDEFGDNAYGKNKKITVEFVSANPTGPLHVGHGRGAAYGASLSNILEKCGYNVQREYYVNDNGRQMDILATSVWLRYVELCGQPVVFPDNGYQGDYIVDIARIVRKKYGDKFLHTSHEIYEGVPADEKSGGDKETHIDGLISNTKSLLGKKDYNKVFQIALNDILSGIKQDLSKFNVNYDSWFSEKLLHSGDTVDRALKILKDNNYLYEKDGAIWFMATHFGDDLDRVVIRENGQKTYFASDVAYLLNKFERGFEGALYLFGADHHGYIARMKAAAKGLGINPDDIEIVLTQFANLIEHGEKVQMGTRSGKFVTLSQLIDDVGVDAARFFYVMRSHDQHLDFDLDLAKSQSNENPVFYIQYAHARICRVFEKLEQEALQYNQEIGLASLNLLDNDSEHDLTRLLSSYPEILTASARTRSPHVLANYLRELAQSFHSYYNEHKIGKLDDESLRNARLCLAKAVKVIIANGLKMLGASAPESMFSEDKD
ncbi:MAG TPA: arginine--tRNA ligase [Gammaproteobacteria bacterium]|nr:arginine--tRNA ligase [Gammaproteobacteria bacterium]HPQ86025.1 arginine--tRNA ligase [Gammaproteobacteria bacterium]